MRNTFSTALPLPSLRIDALRHDGSDFGSSLICFWCCVLGLRFTYVFFSFFRVLLFFLSLTKRYARLSPSSAEEALRRRPCKSSARSKTSPSSLADSRDGRVLRHGRVKLIEASLIRTLAKWSPQNAEATRLRRQLGLETKHIFLRPAASIP